MATDSQHQLHMQAPTKCLPSPPLAAPTTGRISLLLNPLRHTRRGWGIGFALESNRRNSSIPHHQRSPFTEKKHFEPRSVLLFQTVLCDFHNSAVPYILCLSERESIGVAKEDERGAYQGLAMGAKMEGIMERLVQKAQSSLQGEICAKSKNLERKLLC